jgi:hypothetical protein
MSHLPDERLEAIVERARAAETSAPANVDERLHQVALELREARTAQGLATLVGNTSATARAAGRAESLTGDLAALEIAHHQREARNVATARLRAQQATADIELDVRRAARHAQPFVDMDLVTLKRQLTQAERSWRSAIRVAERNDTLNHQWQHEADRLVDEIQRISQVRPSASRARQTVAAEQGLADYADGLQELLDGGRFRPGGLRGEARRQIAA